MYEEYTKLRKCHLFNAFNPRR